MDKNILGNTKSCIISIIKNKEANIILTNFVGFITIYFTLTSVFERNIFFPFQFSLNATENIKVLNNNSNVYNFPVNGKGVTWLSGNEFDTANYYVQTIFSLFVLWTCSVLLGRVSNYFSLTPLLGMLFTGVLFANAPILNGILSIHRSWSDMIQKISFILCLIRCGIGLKMDALRRSWFICANLGIASATFEVVAVVLFVNYFYDISLVVGFLFAFVLASNSPAVTVPAMLELEQQGLGTNKDIPSAMLASVAIDNIYCVTAYTMLNATVFKRSYKDIMYILTRVLVEFFMGTFIGISVGIFLTYVPRSDLYLLHLIRTVLLFTTSCAFLFGSLAVQCEIAGPILVLVMCFVASTKWKIDNKRMNRHEERAFKMIWDVIFLPLLFSLVGLIFDFSVFTWELLLRALITLSLGLIARILSAFLISLCTDLNLKEKFFLAFCFAPKATVQAVLVPFIIRYDAVEMDARFIALTCVLGIVITAPIGQLIIQILGVNFLKKTKTDGEDDGYPTLVSNLSSQSQSQIGSEIDTKKSIFKIGNNKIADSKHQALSTNNMFPDLYLEQQKIETNENELKISDSTESISPKYFCDDIFSDEKFDELNDDSINKK